MADRPASRRPGDRLRSPQRCGAAHSPKILADLSERCPVAHTDRYRELPIQQRLRSIPPALTASPLQLDCSFESICESCVHFTTDQTFQPVVLRQRDHAAAHDQTQRTELFTKLLNQSGPEQ